MESAVELTKTEKSIMDHTIYRAAGQCFIVGEGDSDYDVIQGLIKKGFMKCIGRYPFNEMQVEYGFTVTKEGKEVLKTVH